MNLTSERTPIARPTPAANSVVILVPSLALLYRLVLRGRSAPLRHEQREPGGDRSAAPHEVFHSLVILAAASHFVAMAGWIIPYAA